MWPKFDNSNICMREVIMTSVLFKNLNGKTNFFEGCSWFKVNNLGQTLGMGVNFYTSVAKKFSL